MSNISKLPVIEQEKLSNDIHVRRKKAVILYNDRTHTSNNIIFQVYNYSIFHMDHF